MDGTASECVASENEGLSGLDCGVVAGPLPDNEELVIDDAAGTIVDDAAPASLFVNGGSPTRFISSSEIRGRLPNDRRGPTGCFSARLLSIDLLSGWSGPAFVDLECGLAVEVWVRWLRDVIGAGLARRGGRIGGRTPGISS